MRGPARRALAKALCLSAAVMAAACATPKRAGWRADKITVVENLKIPESVALDRENGCIYVSNCEGDPKKTWVDDGDGFISKVSPEGEMLALHWLKGEPGAILNDPKGLAVFGGHLYVCDNKRLLRVPLDLSGPVEEVELGTDGAFCDPLAFGDHLYVGYGDEQNIIYKIHSSGRVSKIKGVESINGLTQHRGRLYCVTWGTHEIYEIDPEGKTDPVPFGLADNFGNLDGIDVLDDGTFVVSDFKAKRIYTIAPDRKTMKVLAEVDSPADIIVDHRRSLLYVPSYFGGKVTIYRLRAE